MALGLGVLKMPPRDFWAMTIPEFRAAQRGLAGLSGQTPRVAPSQARIKELMARYPDGPRRQKHGQ